MSQRGQAPELCLKATARRAALRAIIAAGAIASALVAAVASTPIAASEPYQDAILFAVLREAKAIDIVQAEAIDAEAAAAEITIWPDRPSALTPRPGDSLFVGSQNGEFEGRHIHNLRGMVERVEKFSSRGSDFAVFAEFQQLMSEALTPDFVR
jgi:hypothetical protein